MAQLNINLPKTEQGMARLKKKNAWLILLLIAVYAVMGWFLLEVFIPLISKETSPLLGGFLFAIVFTFIGVSFIYTIGLIFDRLENCASLTASQHKTYIRLCKTYPVLSQYHRTLERLPVFKELEAFREYDKAAKREEMEKRVKNILAKGHLK